MSETLTIDDLRRAADDILGPPWVRTIRDAEEVEVRVSGYVPDGHIYVLDPNVKGALLKTTLPVTVVCRAEYEDVAKGVVERIRRPHRPHRSEPR